MSKATETMKVYLDAIQALDIDKVVDMFADDVSQGVPFAPEGTPDMIEGKEAVSANFRGLPMMFKKLAYSDVEIVETTDPDFAVGFAHADGELPTGDSYVQTYVFYMRLDAAGKIREYREYMNPVALGQALALLGAAE